MSKSAKIAVGGVAAGIILLIWLPWWAALLIVLGAPAAAYMLLDPRSGAAAPRLAQGAGALRGHRDNRSRTGRSRPARLRRFT